MILGVALVIGEEVLPVLARVDAVLGLWELVSHIFDVFVLLMTVQFGERVTQLLRKFVDSALVLQQELKSCFTTFFKVLDVVNFLKAFAEDSGAGFDFVGASHL